MISYTCDTCSGTYTALNDEDVMTYFDDELTNDLLFNLCLTDWSITTASGGQYTVTCSGCGG